MKLQITGKKRTTVFAMKSATCFTLLISPFILKGYILHNNGLNEGTLQKGDNVLCWKIM